MNFLVTKANHDYWFKIENYNTLEELLENMEKRHSPYIIEKNPHKNIEEMVDFWEGMDRKTAEKIAKLKYHIIIYNDYVE